METLGATKFKATCLEVLERIRRTGEAVTITKRGKPIARVVPALKAPSAYPQRSLKGSVRVIGDIIEPALPREAWLVLSDSRPGRSARRRRR